MTSTIEQAIREIAGNSLDANKVREITQEQIDSSFPFGAVTPAELEDFRSEITQSGNGTDESRVREIFSEALTKAIGAIPPKEIKIDVNGIKTSVEGEHFHRSFEDCLTIVACNEPLYMPGPAGGGKSFLAWQIARALGQDMRVSGPMSSEYKAVGFNDANGLFVPTEAYNAYKYGHIWLHEEMDADQATASVAINMILSEDIVTFGQSERVERHPEFKFIATANTYGRGSDRSYVGRAQQDASTLDRLVFLPVDYDEDLERILCGHDKWCDFVQSVRHAVFDLKLREIVSPRASIKGAKLLAANMNHQKVAKAVVWKGMEDSTVAKIKNHIKGR